MLNLMVRTRERRDTDDISKAYSLLLLYIAQHDYYDLYRILSMSNEIRSLYISTSFTWLYFKKVIFIIVEVLQYTSSFLQ